MPEPAAKESDAIVGTDTHLANGSPVKVPFAGKLDGNLSRNVYIGPEKKRAAFIGSTATNSPAHEPPAGKTFDNSPSNRAVVVEANGYKVFINTKRAARNGDRANTCNDSEDLKRGSILAGGKVFIGR